MNLFLIASTLIIYPLFGLMIYFIRNRLGKAQNIGYLVFVPIILSFLVGVGILFYSLLII